MTEILQYVWTWPLSVATAIIVVAAFHLFISVREAGRKLMIASWLVVMLHNMILEAGFAPTGTSLGRVLAALAVTCGAAGIWVACRTQHDRQCTDRRMRPSWRYTGQERRRQS